MVNTYKKQLGFTLAEALISMLILSIFIGLSMKIFSKKHTRPVYNATHGFYACFRDIQTGLVREISSTGEGRVFEDSDHCSFNPTRVASFYVIYAVGGGGGGGGTAGGAPGQFMTLFVTNIAERINIFPGVGGAVNGSGGETRVESIPEGAGVDPIPMLTVAGGLPGSAFQIQQGFIRGCTAVPLARFLETEASQNYLNSSGSGTRVECEIRPNGVVATMRLRSDDDIRQDEHILDFYRAYAKALSECMNPDYCMFHYYDPKVPGRASYRDGFRDGTNFSYPTMSGKQCIQGKVGSPIYKQFKYCKKDESVGDKLYSRAWTTTDPFVLDGRSTSPVEQVTLRFDQIQLDPNVDTTTVVRSAPVNDPDKPPTIKFILDMFNDMSTLNDSPFISPSGFGEFIENSSLKRQAGVLYDPAHSILTNDDAHAARRFDPAMGDGGYRDMPGYPGAVFIAW